MYELNIQRMLGLISTITSTLQSIFFFPFNEKQSPETRAYLELLICNLQTMQHGMNLQWKHENITKFIYTKYFCQITNITKKFCN